MQSWLILCGGVLAASAQTTYLDGYLNNYDCCGTLPSPSPNIAPETYQQWTVESDRKKCKKPSESTLMFPHSTFFLPCLRLKTGNGPSRPAMRRGWWGSQGIPYCSLWRGLRSGLLPWPSEPVPHHPAPPVPPGCPCWSSGCWGEECGRAERRWRRATGGDRKGFPLGCRGRAVPPRRRRSRRSACWSHRRRSRKARWRGRDLTGPGRLQRRNRHLARGV